MAVIGDAITQARSLLATLEELQQSIDAGASIATPAAPIEAPPNETADEYQSRTALVGHDNDLPFKCPGCGKTFDTQTFCDNQHPPLVTLPTAQVLAGATAGDAAEAPALAAVPEPAATPPAPEQPPATPTPPVEPPASPPWPDTPPA